MRRYRTTVLLVFASFLAYSAVRAPVPGVNEPHYLGKAKHYWNPAWCAGDLFMESADTHVVFYQTVGLLTRAFTLEQTAWIGRGIALGLLAAGWTSLLSRLVSGRWTPLWAAWAFLLLQSLGNLSGEWLVGGVEGKVFAYAFLLLGLAMAGDARWHAAAALAGLAVSFHPVVGVWGVIAALFAVLCAVWASSPISVWERVRVNAASIGMTLLILVLFSLPGLLPALAVVRQGSTWKADYLQVFFRLPHHLDPMQFSARAYAAYGTMFVIWLTLWRWPHCSPHPARMGDSDSPPSEGGAGGVGSNQRLGISEETSGRGVWIERESSQSLDIAGAPQPPLPPLRKGGSTMAATRHVEQRGHWSSGVGAARLFRGFVIGALLIAVAGFLVGAGPRPATEMPLIETRIKLMKFYPFRLFDAVMPLALAAALAGSVARLVSRGDRSDPVSENRALPALATAAFAAAFLLAVSIPAPDRNPSRMPPKQRADWIDACRWIAANAPQDSIFFTPGETWAFKWYAERPEYVSKKDCPQDASGIVEWNRRLVTIARWSRRHYHPQTGYSREAVRDLHAQTGISHILTGRVGPFPLDPIYENGTYKVFRVPEGQ